MFNLRTTYLPENQSGAAPVISVEQAAKNAAADRKPAAGAMPPKSEVTCPPPNDPQKR
jgi:hypothetical protein